MSHLAAPDLELADQEASRRRAALGRWKRRSGMIHFFRRALPWAMGLIALGLAAAVIVTAVMSRRTESEAAGDGVRLVNPRFYGRDDKGQAFVLAAKEAVRDPKRETTITLTAPDMTLNSEGDRSTRVQADRGVYREDEKVLRLEGNVRLEDEGGYRFRTEEAIVDTETNIVRGTKPLEGTGPTGRIAADSYTLYDQGARTRFSGRVRARLERGAQAASGTAQGDDR
jgi:lipopolysaccharide export system protein LptC